MVGVGCTAYALVFIKTTRATNCLLDVQHGISAILKVGSPSQMLNIPFIFIDFLSYRVNFRLHPRVREVAQNKNPTKARA